MVLPRLNELRIGVVGTGYVGLPLAVYMARNFPVLGFDINADRVRELNQRVDRTHEVTAEEFAAATDIRFSSNPEHLKEANFFIVTVPTPINKARQPDLRALEAACETVGAALKKNDVVVFESTVYPGVTEEICVPILENSSRLAFNDD